MVRSPCCSKEGLNRGVWTAKEDRILSDYIRIHGDRGWTNLPQKTGLQRSGKSCRLRWLNYLRPGIKRGNISPDEEELIIRLHRLLGNRWSLIAGRLPERTDNEIKNYWKSHLSKKLSLINQRSTTENLKIRSKSPSLVENHVLITIPVKKITAMSESEVVISNGFNGYDCSNHNSQHDSKSIGMEGINPTCSMSTIVESGTSSDSELLGGNAATLTESMFDLNDLLSSEYNLISSTSEICRGFGVEEFYQATLSAEEIQFEVTCYDERNMQRLNSFTFANDQGMTHFECDKEHLDWIHELDYIQKSSPQSPNSLLLESKEA